jgi:hypothetical protein
MGFGFTLFIVPLLGITAIVLLVRYWMTKRTLFLNVFLVLFWIPFLPMFFALFSYPDEKKLPGAYCFNDGSFNDSLYVYVDHTYRHRFQASDQKVYESSGTWTYSTPSARMIFHEFQFYNEQGPAGRGEWDVEVVTSEEEVKIYYAIEEDIYYHRKTADKEKNAL